MNMITYVQISIHFNTELRYRNVFQILSIELNTYFEVALVRHLRVRLAVHDDRILGAVRAAAGVGVEKVERVVVRLADDVRSGTEPVFLWDHPNVTTASAFRGNLTNIDVVREVQRGMGSLIEKILQTRSSFDGWSLFVCVV